MRKPRTWSHAFNAMLLSIVLVGVLIAPAAAAEDGVEDSAEGVESVADPGAGCEFTASVEGSELHKYRYERETPTTVEQFKYKKQQWKWNWGTWSSKKTESNVGNTRYGRWSWAQVNGQHVVTGWIDAGEPVWNGHHVDEVFAVGRGWYRYVQWGSSQTVDGPPEVESRWSFSELDAPWVLVETKLWDAEPNRVRVLVDGDEVDRVRFGTAWTKDYTLDHEQTFVVQVKLAGERKWTTVDSGTAHCPPQPEALVVPGEWEDGAWVCDDTEVTQTRTVTTTPYIWDGEEWVEDTAAATSEEETQVRQLTDEEIHLCPEQPDDLVVFSEWEEGEWTCDDTHVTRTRTVTTTPYLWDAESETWIEDTENATTEQEALLRELTEDELEACAEVEDAAETRDEEPEVLDTAVERAPQVEDTKVLGTTLARTGFGVVGLLIMGLLALVTGASALRRRRDG